ncbi:MAG: DUF998 domain-containing protein [Actinomycetota bacterium]|nr:DUF998 domain-containing protein [Actinomycetota bacterium]
MKDPAATRASTWIGAIAAIIAAACYSSFLLSPWTHAARSAGGGFISELEAPGQPFAWLYRTSDVLAGLGVIAAAWAVRRLIAGRRWSVLAVVLMVLAGASSILDAATSMQCDPNASARCAQGEHTALGLLGQLVNVHTDSGLLGFLGGAAGASILGVVIADRWPGWGRVQIALGIGIASCGLADIGLLLASSDIGWAERIRVLLTSGWFLVVGLFLLHDHIVSRPGTAETL